MEDKLTAVLCDGLSKLEPYAPEDILILGMGGELIATILEGAPWVKKQGVRLILQPMTRAEKLRQYLFDNGYNIELEQAVEDDGRIYSVMRVRGGSGDCGENNGFLFSGSFVRDSLFDKYIDKLIQKYQAVYRGKLSASNDVSEELRLIKLLEDAHAHR
jgi:tRNA (adenine22-N1)-methyltransferase